MKSAERCEGAHKQRNNIQRGNRFDFALTTHPWLLIEVSFLILDDI